MGKGSSKAVRDNRANQMNPNSAAYATSRSSAKAAADNRSNQLNPNSEAYQSSRVPTQPSEQWKNEHPGAWVDHTANSSPDLMDGVAPGPPKPKDEKKG